MALRALRDGQPLDFGTYLAYGEWSPSSVGVMAFGTAQAGDDFVETVSLCPWAQTFAGMGQGDCGRAYCAEIDRSLIRGFNPELCFEITTTLHDGEQCVQILKDFRPQKTIEAPGDGKRDWRYHCAHLFAAMTEVVLASGYTGAAEKVRTEFIEQFGDEAYRGIDETGINFNIP
jgi:hypothetical protein